MQKDKKSEKSEFYSRYFETIVSNKIWVRVIIILFAGHIKILYVKILSYLDLSKRLVIGSKSLLVFYLSPLYFGYLIKMVFKIWQGFKISQFPILFVNFVNFKEIIRTSADFFSLDWRHSNFVACRSRLTGVKPFHLKENKKLLGVLDGCWYALFLFSLCTTKLWANGWHRVQKWYGIWHRLHVCLQ